MSIESTSLWDKITEKLNGENLWGWKIIEDEPYLSCCRFEKSWVAEIVRKEDAKQITSDTPVFIVAQTGTGKSTCIFESCLPVAREEGMKLLYICNRTSLALQMKHRCMNDELNGREKVGDILVKDMLEYYTKKYLACNSNFGGVDVYTYQAFLHIHKKLDASQYAFVIIDEAHYFLSDSTFNLFTEEVLNTIVNKFANTRRVYLTATPQESIQSIYEKEADLLSRRGSMFEKMKNTYSSRALKVYAMDEDYSYLRPYFFKGVDFIIEKIMQSSVTDYWLVFVRDIVTGEKLLNKLKGIEGGVEFFTAESDREAETYLDLINNEKLPKRVLISTKVLDVGVNIRTENLHMVVFEDNCVELKQMIGRKRIKNGESLEVYFFVPNLKKLVKRSAQVKKALVEETKNAKDKECFEKGYSKELPHPLYFHKGIKANLFSIKKLQSDWREYQKLIQQLKPYAEDDYSYMKQYAQIMLKSFAGQDFVEGMLLELSQEGDLSKKKQLEVDSIMRSWIGRTFSKVELEQLSMDLTGAVGECRAVQRADRKTMGITTMNKVLSKYGYNVESLKKTPVEYRIKLTREEDV